MGKKKPKRRRRRGEGSITQRKDGSWVGYVLTDQYKNGRRVRRYASGATYEEVRRKLAKLQSSADAGTLLDASDLTVSQHLDHYLPHSVKNTVRASTFANVERLARLHIKPAIGSMRVRAVSEFTIEQMVSSITKSVSAEVARKSLSLLSRSFEKLIPKILSSNPCERVSRPRITRGNIHPLTKEESELFMDHFQSDRLGSLFVLAVLSGARVGELLALSWSDVDFQYGAIAINKTLSNQGKRTTIEEPKSKQSRRRILLPERAMETLFAHRKKILVEGNAGAGTVFCTKRGGITSRAVLHYRFKRLLKTSGLQDIRFHDLRHTHATLLLLAGENPKIVSERMGHSSIRITLDLYSHVIPSMQEQAKDKLETMFGKSG